MTQAKLIDLAGVTQSKVSTSHRIPYGFQSSLSSVFGKAVALQVLAVST
jgi:hypothetical protein